jgi:hypothetical protein
MRKLINKQITIISIGVIVALSVTALLIYLNFQRMSAPEFGNGHFSALITLHFMGIDAHRFYPISLCVILN